MYKLQFNWNEGKDNYDRIRYITMKEVNYLIEQFLLDLLNKAEYEKKHLLSLYKHIMDDQKVRQITAQLMHIKDDAGVPNLTREDTLSRVKRFIDSANKDTVKDPTSGVLKPITTQFMVVCVNFTGIGSEQDEFHYGIVWDEQRKRDNVSIIPTTSFKAEKTLDTDLSFNIGHVSFLQGETVVLMNQITSVSRKRIRNVRHKNPITDKFEIVKLSPEQQNRIKDGFRIYGLKERSLYNEFIYNSFVDTLPILEYPEVQYFHLNRPIRLVENYKNKLTYKLYDDEKVYVIERKPYKLPSGTNRIGLLKSWVEAVAIMDPLSKKIITMRDKVRQSAYEEIQNAIQAFGEDNEAELKSS
ncbi:type II toxin-antitoxin system PemK/MazF family toxin [Paenibacillus sp. IHB B 3084]|uniref:type II toxin-antitoxin system PemK/MazF family toxin n=2 Tax=unclassified Paenibacillus TaxID=185978 RepID=UPI00167065D6|nr:type II toxin-antitoxin system PemK/MazF family toxin [Paenibacillus sp. IHB B 3084]